MNPKSMALIGVVTGLVMIGLGLLQYWRGDSGLGFVVCGGLVIFVSAKQFIAEESFSTAELVIVSPRGGAAAQLLLTLVPRRPLALRPGGSSVTLKTTERGFESGDSYERVLYERVDPLDLPGELTGPLEEQIVVRVPPEVPATVASRPTEVTTRVLVLIAMAKGPDLRLGGSIEVGES